MLYHSKMALASSAISATSLSAEYYGCLDDSFDDVGPSNSLRRKPEKTAGIIIIGDEILKGHTKDTNSAFLLSKLWSIGVKVERVSVIGDSLTEISNEIKSFSSKYSLVLTSGGIGPTHDDITYAGVADAFGEELEENKEMMVIIERLMKNSKLTMTPSVMKMAHLPKSARLIIGTDPITLKPALFPLVSCHNVYIFPGIPEYMEKSFEINQNIFATGGDSFYLTKLYLNIDETAIASCIEDVNEKFKETVHIGSYPVINDLYQVKITLESLDQKSIDLAYNDLLDTIPAETIVSAKKCLPNTRTMHYEVFHKAADSSGRVPAFRRNFSVSNFSK